MEQGGGNGRARKAMKVNQCMPRLIRTNRPVAGTAPAMSLLERLREVVFKLIMLSAFSKSSRPAPQSPKQRRQSWSAAAAGGCRQPDMHRSEDVEECIEFLKRSSEGQHGGAKNSNASEVSIDQIGNYQALTVL